MNLSSLNWKKHIDVAVGIGIFLLAAQFVPEQWGWVAIVLGVAAYTQRVLPESK